MNKIIAYIIYYILNISAKILMKIGRYVGFNYTKIWYYLHSSWFDHRFDYLRGIDNFFWYERGVLGVRLISRNDSVLEIGSGDGIYSGLFYSRKAKHVDAIDIDPGAISHAKKYYNNPNVSYIFCDALKDSFPSNKYDIVIMFVVIEHFKPQDGRSLLRKIAGSLNKNGLFFGSTAIFETTGGHNIEHKNEFTSISKLKRFLGTYFSDIQLYTSDWNGRTECYFECRKPKYSQ